MPEPHLYPMPPNGLAPHPVPQAAASRQEIKLAEATPTAPEPLLRPASFAPAQPEPEAEEDLLGGFLLLEEDDEPDDGPDAVPSEELPQPACVPLFEIAADVKCRRWGRRKRD